jgi:hypothetical protein
MDPWTLNTNGPIAKWRPNEWSDFHRLEMLWLTALPMIRANRCCSFHRSCRLTECTCGSFARWNTQDYTAQRNTMKSPNWTFMYSIIRTPHAFEQGKWNLDHQFNSIEHYWLKDCQFARSPTFLSIHTRSYKHTPVAQIPIIRCNVCKDVLSF